MHLCGRELAVVWGLALRLRGAYVCLASRGAKREAYMHVLARSGICVCVHACVDGWTGGRYRWMGGWTEGGVEGCVCVCACRWMGGQGGHT